MNPKKRHIFMAISVLVCLVASSTMADVWPTYRHDVARSGISPDPIEFPLSLQWEYTAMHAPQPAWPQPGEERARMHFDSAYHVTISDDLVYFGCSVNDRVYALDIETGEVKWDFFTDGPIRFAPTLWKDRIYFGSDDGCVYCLDAKEGQLIWVYRPGATSERLLGKGRMVSMWPVRTNVLVDEGVAYFGAGVFPHEGHYICAVDADTGEEIWVNDTIADHAHELKYGGISPQSYLVASNHILYVPSGRAMPAAFDRKNGKFLHYLSPPGKVGGCWALLAEGEIIAGVDKQSIPAKVAYDAETGQRIGDKYAWFPGQDLLVTEDTSYALMNEGIVSINRARYPEISQKIQESSGEQRKLMETVYGLRSKLDELEGDRKEKANNKIDALTKKLYEMKEQEKELKASTLNWKYANAHLKTMVLSKGVVIAGGENVVVVLDAMNGAVKWESKVQGTVLGLAAANGRFWASTKEGGIYCFGKEDGKEPRIHAPKAVSNPYGDRNKKEELQATIDQIVKQAGSKGYCLLLNGSSGRLAYELVQQTDYHVVALEKDVKTLRETRDMLDRAGVYGSRVVVQPWDLDDLPDYFANAIVVGEPAFVKELDASPAQLFRVLKPYGGALVLGIEGHRLQFTSSKYKQEWNRHFPKADMSHGRWITFARGPLEGAGQWTSLYGNPQNTCCSEDPYVKTPLGLLWYGEPGSEKIVDRHGRAAGPIAFNGKLYVQGEEVVMAFDAYNGTLLWEREIDGAVRVRVDVDGGNLSIDETGLYVAAKKQCYQLDPNTGETMNRFQMPFYEAMETKDGQPRRWGYVMTLGDTLLGTTSMPLKLEYAATWDMLVTEDGEWKSPGDVANQLPEKYRNRLLGYYQFFLEQFPKPNADAWHKMHEVGLLWGGMDDYPNWRSEENPAESMQHRMLYCDSIFALDPETGFPKWNYEGKKIPNIAPTIGKGIVYITDAEVTEAERKQALAQRRRWIEQGLYEVGTEAELDPSQCDVRRVIAIDLKSGDIQWQRVMDLTGCGGYRMGSAYHDDGLLVFMGHFSNHDKNMFNQNKIVWRRLTTVSAETGELVWSRPLNYLRRPLIMGDKIVIEPRFCDVHTGEIILRDHPISGRPVPQEFYRPGHSCSVTSGSQDCIFFRSYNNAYFDVEQDRGLSYFGGIRTGCWVNYVPANGLLMIPESSSGCTCSFPLRCTVVLKHREAKRSSDWSMYIAHGPQTPARHLAVNFGAPGDMKDDAGTVWFGYPRKDTVDQKGDPYGLKFDLNETVRNGIGYYERDFKGVEFNGTDKPWLFTNGCQGLRKFSLPLIDDVWGQEPGKYTLRLGFLAPEGDRVGQRVFSIKIQGQTVVEHFDILQEAGSHSTVVIKEFPGIRVDNSLVVELAPKALHPTVGEAPVIQFAEAIRTDQTKSVEINQEVKTYTKAALQNRLKHARQNLADGQNEKALAAFHTVLDHAKADAMKIAALHGMQKVGCPSSLPHIKSYCENDELILWEYQELDPELVNSSYRVYLAVAETVMGDDRAKARRMLERTAEFNLDDELKQQRETLLQSLN